jgi:acyl-ACP thioesterase
LRGGLGFDEMLKKNLAWVITKMRFEVYQSFAPSEVVTVETAPHPKGSVDYTRDYYIYKEDGSLAVKGSSQWVLIDFTARKIVRPCVDFVGEFTDKRAFEGRLPKVIAVDSIYLGSHTVNRIDLDHNGHTNNIRYA